MEKYNEWRVLTPALLAGLSILLAIVGWFCSDKLGSIDGKIDKTFASIGQIRSDFSSYQVQAEARFVRLETDVNQIQKRVDP